MRRALLPPALLLALLPAACGGEGPPDPPPPPVEYDVDVGTAVPSAVDPGVTDYVPLEDGAELELEPGAQGGFHVFVQIRVPKAAIADMGARPFVRRAARRVDTNELVSRGERHHAFVETADADVVELETPILLFLCPTPIGIAVGDQALDLEVEVSADDETEGVKGHLRFTPRCPSGDQNQFCNNICFG